MSQHGTSFSGELSDSSAVVKEMKGYPCPTTVWVRPGPASPTNGISVWYSLDGGINYDLWAAGEVFANTSTVFDSPISHLKFQRTTGSEPGATYGAC